MLWTIAVILIVLWALGLVSSYTMGGFIHILLVIAIIMVLVRTGYYFLMQIRDRFSTLTHF
jgi:hypothetical protein